MYDTIQNLLTLAIEATCVIGFGSLVVNSIWQHHRRFMRDYCPPVKPFTAAETKSVTDKEDETLAYFTDQLTHGEERVPEKLVNSPDPEAPPVIADPWEAPATFSGRRWVSPQTRLQQPEIDLNALDAVALRKLCSQYKIQWRDVRGKNRHATKAMMIFQLNQKAVA